MGGPVDHGPVVSRLPAGVRRALSARFGVDSRALAALRIALGLLLLTDLWIRSRDLVAHYTDAGVLPMAMLREQFGVLAGLSIHGLSGAAPVQGLLFVLAGAVAVALLVGFWTRLATGLSLVLLVSLHVRNPLVLNAGDALLRRLLLWGLFLPLAGCWSLDGLRGAPTRGDGSGPDPGATAGDEPRRVVSLASAALLLQVVVVYVVNAAIKLRGDAWPSGEAVVTVFGRDHLTVLLGDVLAGYPGLLRLLGRLWLGLLVGSILLVLLTGRYRTALVSLFAAGHLGMFLTLRLGLFPLVSVAALLPFLPPAVWDRVDRAWRRIADRHRVRRWLGRLSRSAVARTRREPVLPDRVRRVGRPVATVVVALLLVFFGTWNAVALGYVDADGSGVGGSGGDGSIDPSDRRWDMFAPAPQSTDGWYVVPGRLTTGDRVDAFHGGPVRWDRPPELAATYPSHRWFVYLLNYASGSYPDVGPGLGAHLCDRWNDTHDTGLRNVTVVYQMETTRTDASPADRRFELLEYSCSDRTADP